MKTIQKTYILKIIFIVFIVSMSFVFAISISLAQITTSEIPATFFTFSENTKIRHIDMSAENKVKVCKDVSCTNPGIINFEISDDSPLVIDAINGLSGKVYGNELGWIIFNPPYGGVSFANPTTGLLKGTAWSETSGAINFEVTGQKVIIDPKTGEWNGWAWASGPYGGWIKFDCEDASCVKTTIEDIKTPLENEESFSTVNVEKNEKTNISWTSNIQRTYREKSEIINNTFNIFISSSEDLFNKAGRITSDVYNAIDSYSMSLRNSVFNK